MCDVSSITSTRRRSKWSTFMKENALTILTVVGVVGGGVLAAILRVYTPMPWSKRHVMYLAYPGELFLRMLKVLIIPLLVSSIVTAIGSLDLSMSRKVGLRAVLYYMSTTIGAVILGIILVVTIRPGVSVTAPDASQQSNHNEIQKRLTTDTLLDLLRNVFPPNIMQACISQFSTKLLNKTDGSDETFDSSDMRTWPIDHKYEGGTNVLGLVSFSIVLGLTLGKMGPAAKPLFDLFHSLSETMMIITEWVIWLSPVGVFFLISSKLMEFDSLEEMFKLLSWYFLTVLLGLFLHGFGTLSLIFFVATRTLPFRYIAKMSQVLVTAFGTASSSATMPITIQWCDKQGIDERITRFVIPIGANINMDGTALYEAVAAIFISQVRNLSLSFGNIVAISVTATAASIGAAGIPQAGLVTMVMVLDTVGLPADDVILILAVDWLLDRFRTTINVMCDVLGALCVAKMSEGDLDRNRLEHLDREIAHDQELAELGKPLQAPPRQ